MFTLIGSCRIYSIFQIKAGRFRKRYRACNRFANENLSPRLFSNIAPNMQVDLCATPLLTIDEVEKVQRQKIASFIGQVFQLTYAALIDKLI